MQEAEAGVELKNVVIGNLGRATRKNGVAGSRIFQS